MSTEREELDFNTMEAVCAILRAYANDLDDAKWEVEEGEVYEADFANEIVRTLASSDWLTDNNAAVEAAVREKVAAEIEAEAERLAVKTVSERDRSIHLRAQGADKRADLAMKHAHALRHQTRGHYDAAYIARGGSR